MAIFEYRACTDAGRLMTGSIEAGDPEQARRLLEEMDLQVSELQKAHSSDERKAVGKNDFLLFNQQLASITRAGIPLERGLRELAEDAGTPKMRKLLDQIAGELEKGIPIEQAVEKNRSSFPPLYSLILKSGIETGRLAEMLTSLNRHLEVELRTRRIITQAFSYPAIVLALAIGIATFMLTLIVPVYETMFMDLRGGEVGLSQPTRAVFFLSRHIGTIWGIIAVLIVFLGTLWLLMGSLDSGRRMKESFYASLPMVGRVYKNGLLSRFAESLAVLVNSGCGLETAVRLAGQSSGSEMLKKESDFIAEQLEEGHNFLEAGFRCRLIPRLFLYTAQLGAQRNELLENLKSLAGMYATKTYSLQNQLQTMLLPCLVVFAGGVVGLFVAAIMLPMIRMVTVLM